MLCSPWWQCTVQQPGPLPACALPCCEPESCRDVLEDPCSFPRRGRPALGTWLPRKARAGRVPERWVNEGVIQSGVAVRHPEQAPLPPLLGSFPSQISSQPKQCKKGGVRQCQQDQSAARDRTWAGAGQVLDYSDLCVWCCPLHQQMRGWRL